MAQKKTKENKKSEAENKLLSFLGGILVFSVVLGIVVSKDERIRQEIQKQIRRFLETSKDVLVQYENLAKRINKFAGQAKNAKKSGKLEDNKNSLDGDDYEQQWAALEGEATRYTHTSEHTR